MMDCKKVLIEIDGDMDKVIDFLREKGIVKVVKKVDCIVVEGFIFIKIDGNKGVILEVNFEIDFVVKNEGFKEFFNILVDYFFVNVLVDVEEVMV